MCKIKEDKKVFLVGKSALNFLIEPVALTEKKKISCNECSNCIFKNSSNPIHIRYCSEFCEHKDGKIITLSKFRPKHGITKANNIKRALIKPEVLHNFKLSRLLKKQSTYVTPLQSKIMLAYFHISNNKGIINCLAQSELARFVGCSTKSIENVNKTLSKYGLITYQKHTNNTLTIIINNFEEQYSKAGRGYVVMSTKLFKKLLSIRNVHMMRIALKAILLCDANNFFGNETSFSQKRLKSFLPKYMSTKRHIGDFIKNVLELFKEGLESSIFMGMKLTFRLDDSYNGKSLKESLIKTYLNNFSEEFKNKIIPVTDEADKASTLALLSLEYDYRDVLHLFKVAPPDLLNTTPSKFGANFRYLLERLSSDINFLTVSE